MSENDVAGLYAHFDRLRAACRGLAPLPTAVVCPDQENVLAGVLAAQREGLIDPVLVGHPERIAAAATDLRESVDRLEIEPAPDASAAIERAIALVREGHARALMKGNVHSDLLLSHVLRRDGGLRGERFLSHSWVVDAPGFPRLLHVTDGVLNLAPDVAMKREIIVNAVELARACGTERPRVAVLSSLETVNPKMSSAVDAALLAKMSERGQIENAIVDGPLAMDNAVSEAAARIKGIRSEVAGHADVLVVPAIEAGNMLVKALTFVGSAEAAGILLGASVPVMLTSRADSPLARIVSCALALLLDDWRRTGRSRVAPAADRAPGP